METQAQPGKVNILLVDDHLENLLALEAVLSSPHYHLVRAISGKEALGAILRQDFAVILLDINMPELSGFDTAILIKQREKSREIPIVFITATYKDEVSIRRAYEAGGVDFIVKPFDPQILRAKVGAYVEFYRRGIRIEQEAERARLRERKIAEEEIAAAKKLSEERFKNLVNHLDHAIVWTMSPDTGKFLFIGQNAERITGYSLAEWYSDSKFLEKHIPPEDFPLFRETLTKAQASGVAPRCEHRLIARDGRTLWFQSALHRVENSLDGVGEFHGVCMEITPTKEAIEIRDLFVATLTHDLRNPLAAIRASCQMIQKQTDHPEKVSQRARRIQSGADRIDRMIQDLLDTSRARAGMALTIRPTECDLTKIVRQALDELRLTHGNRFELVSDGPMLGIWDGDDLRRMVENLATNAIKYGARDRPVTVSLAKAGDQIELSVHNHGGELSSEEQAQLFHPFRRTASANRSGQKGWGIGLTLVKAIAHAHGGTISVRSGAGDGTTFAVRLPRDPVTPPDAS